MPNEHWDIQKAKDAVKKAEDRVDFWRDLKARITVGRKAWPVPRNPSDDIRETEEVGSDGQKVWRYDPEPLLQIGTKAMTRFDKTPTIPWSRLCPNLPELCDQMRVEAERDVVAAKRAFVDAVNNTWGREIDAIPAPDPTEVATTRIGKRPVALED